MLKKLMKYEIKATARFLVPFFLLVIWLGLFSRIIVSMLKLYWKIQNRTILPNMQILDRLTEVTYTLTMTLLPISVILVGCLAPIICAYRFYHNLLKDEGYLMMTLPVTSSQHLWAKIHTTVLWTICSGLIVIALSFMFSLHNNMSDLNSAFQSQESLVEMYGSRYVSSIVLWTIFVIISIYQIAAYFFFCLMAGHRLSGKHPLVVAMALCFVISVMVFNGLWSLAKMMSNTITVVDPYSSLTAFNMVISTFIVIFVVGFVICFIASKRILDTKLNLQ